MKSLFFILIRAQMENPIPNIQEQGRLSPAKLRDGSQSLSAKNDGTHAVISAFKF